MAAKKKAPIVSEPETEAPPVFVTYDATAKLPGYLGETKGHVVAERTEAEFTILFVFDGRRHWIKKDWIIT